MKQKLIISRISDLYDIDHYFESMAPEVECLRFMMGLDRNLNQLPIGSVKPKEPYLQFLLTFMMLGWGELNLVDGYPVAMSTRIRESMRMAATQLGMGTEFEIPIVYHQVKTKKDMSNKLVDLRTKKNYLDLTESYEAFKNYILDRYEPFRNKQEEFEKKIMEEQAKQTEHTH